MKNSKFAMPFVAFLAIVLALSTTAFTPKSFDATTKTSKLSTLYVYIGDASPSEQRDPSNYVKPSLDHPIPEECGGTEMVCTILTDTDEGANPVSFTPTSNPYDRPEDFDTEQKPEPVR